MSLNSGLIVAPGPRRKIISSAGQIIEFLGQFPDACDHVLTFVRRHCYPLA